MSMAKQSLLAGGERFHREEEEEVPQGRKRGEQGGFSGSSQ